MDSIILNLEEKIDKIHQDFDLIKDKIKELEVKDIDKICDLTKKEGTTEVIINISHENNDISFKLKNKRLIDRKAINILRNNDISAIIH